MRVDYGYIAFLGVYFSDPNVSSAAGIHGDDSGSRNQRVEDATSSLQAVQYVEDLRPPRTTNPLPDSCAFRDGGVIPG